MIQEAIYNELARLMSKDLIPDEIRDDYGRGLSTIKLAKILDIKRNQTLSDFIYNGGSIGIKICEKLMIYLDLGVYRNNG